VGIPLDLEGIIAKHTRSHLTPCTAGCLADAIKAAGYLSPQEVAKKERAAEQRGRDEAACARGCLIMGEALQATGEEVDFSEFYIGDGDDRSGGGA
jgi:hypothetical protein